MTHRQHTEEVEAALANELQKLFLSDAVFAVVLEVVQAALRPESQVMPYAIEPQLAEAKREQANLMKAIKAAATDEAISGLTVEFQAAVAKVRALEFALARSRRPPPALSTEAVEKAVRARLADLASFLARQDVTSRRDFLRALFPDGLRCEPVGEGRRTVWDVSGAARLDLSNTASDPTGSRRKLDPRGHGRPGGRQAGGMTRDRERAGEGQDRAPTGRARQGA